MEKIELSKIRPYERNAKLHTDKQIKQIFCSKSCAVRNRLGISPTNYYQ